MFCFTLYRSDEEAHCSARTTFTTRRNSSETFKTMEYMTILVRWARAPQRHINFITDKVTRWYMSRWTYGNLVSRHLTVICVQIALHDIAEYRKQLLNVMRVLWVEPTFNLMDCEMFDTLVDNKNGLSATLNKYSVTHTDASPVSNFYSHVMNTVKLVKGSDWNLRKDTDVADHRTSFKMYCRHEPHSVTVLVPGTATKTITIRCEEPQRIYDLLKTYGLTCSNVWDSTIALSARSPCTALCDHNMTIINVNRIPSKDTFGQEPEVRHFYHNRKYIRMQTNRGVLRHEPYTIPRRSLVDIPSLPPTTATQNESVENKISCIPVALYYDDYMSKLSDVIKEDGRFVPTDGGDTCMIELEQDNALVITGTEPEERSGEDDAGNARPASAVIKPLPCA